MIPCLQCGQPHMMRGNKMACEKCLDSIKEEHLRKLRLELSQVAIELCAVSPKVDSGRCKMSDVQRMHQLIHRYLDIEQKIESETR